MPENFWGLPQNADPGRGTMPCVKRRREVPRGAPGDCYDVNEPSLEPRAIAWETLRALAQFRPERRDVLALTALGLTTCEVGAHPRRQPAHRRVPAPLDAPRLHPRPSPMEAPLTALDLNLETVLDMSLPPPTKKKGNGDAFPGPPYHRIVVMGAAMLDAAYRLRHPWIVGEGRNEFAALAALVAFLNAKLTAGVDVTIVS